MKTEEIMAAMAKRWAPPEYAILWNVANGTGARQRRFADALIMSLFPSRGLELHGIEIKVSRSDWRREAADPHKAETIAAYCDRWYIHTPKDLIDDISDVPPAWGLREWSGKQWRTIREAEKTEAKPIDRPFLAAMLRRSEEAASAVARQATADERAALEEERRAMVARSNEHIRKEVERITRGSEMLKESVAAFEEKTGIRITAFDDRTDVATAANAVHRLVRGNRIDHLINDMEEAIAAVRRLSGLVDGKR